MSLVDHMPTSTKARTATLVGAAGAWTAAYWVNGRLWDLVFYDVLGMAPDDRLTSSLHFFFYDTTGDPLRVRPPRRVMSG